MPECAPDRSRGTWLQRVLKRAPLLRSGHDSPFNNWDLCLHIESFLQGCVQGSHAQDPERQSAMKAHALRPMLYKAVRGGCGIAHGCAPRQRLDVACTVWNARWQFCQRVFDMAQGMVYDSYRGHPVWQVWDTSGRSSGKFLTMATQGSLWTLAIGAICADGKTRLPMHKYNYRAAEFAHYFQTFDHYHCLPSMSPSVQIEMECYIKQYCLSSAPARQQVTCAEQRYVPESVLSRMSKSSWDLSPDCYMHSRLYEVFAGCYCCLKVVLYMGESRAMVRINIWPEARRRPWTRLDSRDLPIPCHTFEYNGGTTGPRIRCPRAMRL